jgi:hypothetical protein
MQTSALRVDSDTMSLTGNHGCDMGTTGDKTYIRKTVVFNGTSIGKSWTIYRKPWFKLVLMDCFTENVYETIEFYPHFFSGVPDFVPPFRIDITKQKNMGMFMSNFQIPSTSSRDTPVYCIYPFLILGTISLQK